MPSQPVDPLNHRLIAQLNQWRDELIDFSRRNRLLHCRANQTSTVEITEPGAGAVLDGLTRGQGWRFFYPPLDDAQYQDCDEATRAALGYEDPDLDSMRHADELVTTVTTAQGLSRILKNLSARASAEYLDKGLQILYLGIGLVEWSDANGQTLESPLVLVPVTLERPNPRAPFRMTSSEDDAVVNPALIAKLVREYELELPPREDTAPVEEYVDVVRRCFVDHQFPGTVVQRTMLSYFSFHKEVMYRDLESNSDRLQTHPIVRALALGRTDSADEQFDLIDNAVLDEVAPPERLVSILDADSTQRQCIIAARDGRSFVMDGPPGSGKSQTIANVIAEVLHSGQSVLFVSEKAAALEVVHNRLAESHLDHFVLELHSHKAVARRSRKNSVASLAPRSKPRVHFATKTSRRFAAAANSSTIMQRG